VSSTHYVDVNRTLQNLETELDSENVEALREFVNHCAAEGISEVRQARLVSSWENIDQESQSGKFTLREANEQELKEIVAGLNRFFRPDSRLSIRADLLDLG